MQTNRRQDFMEICPACGEPGIDPQQKYSVDTEDHEAPVECNKCGAHFRLATAWHLKWMLIINVPALVMLLLVNDKTEHSAWWYAIPGTAVLISMICWTLDRRKAPLRRIKQSS